MAWVIVLPDRIGYLGRLAIVHGVVASHRALEFGKFAHHAREQVGFRQPGCAFREDRVGLFAGTDGLFGGFHRFEQTASLEPGAQVLAGAGEEEGRPVIVAYALGNGLVIRTGLPEWSSRLTEDPNVDAVTRRAWTLLSR